MVLYLSFCFVVLSRHFLVHFGHAPSDITLQCMLDSCARHVLYIVFWFAVDHYSQPLWFLCHTSRLCVGFHLPACDFLVPMVLVVFAAQRGCGQFLFAGSMLDCFMTPNPMSMNTSMLPPELRCAERSDERVVGCFCFLGSRWASHAWCCPRTGQGGVGHVGHLSVI